MKVKNKSSLGGGENKESYKDYLIICKKHGKFYNVFEMDAYIISELFNYKVLDNYKGGFPDTALNKVLNKLEELKISYKIFFLDKEPIEKNFKKLNKYNYYYDLAFNNLSMKNRMDFLIEKVKDAPDDVLDKIIESIEQCLR